MDHNLIIVKRIPKEFSVNDCMDLFSFFNSKSLKYVTNTGNIGNTAFVTFNCSEDAVFAMLNLHERRILNNNLSVKLLRKNSTELFDLGVNFEELTKNDNSDIIPEWINELLALSPSINFTEPMKPKLRYKYPKPNNIILTNIVRALYSNQKFYNQTLHLMNKFNFPIPFSPDTLFPGNLVVMNDIKTIKNKNSISKIKKFEKEIEISSSNESEISDDSYFPNIKKRKHCLSKFKSVPTLINYPFNSEPKEKYSIEELFDKDKNNSKNQINFNVPSSIQSKIGTNCQITKVFDEDEAFGKINEINNDGNIENMSLSVPNIISDQRNMLHDINELSFELIEKPINMMSIEDIKSKTLSENLCASINAFKNYNPGIPSNRLYIKNLAKKVSRKDLIYLYSSFINWSDNEEVKLFSITFFNHGRMKGQAFINFPSKSLSERALEMTNAFVLYDKPIVVQFAKTENGNG